MNNTKTACIYLLALLATCSFSSCSDAQRKADISDIDLAIKIGRFDQAFWDLDTLNMRETVSAMIEVYPEMSSIYLENVLRFGRVDSDITWDTYRIFRRDTAVNALYTDVEEKYKDVEEIEKQLSLAFRRGKYFFPAIPTPNIYMHVSGFNQSIVVGSDFLSLSADNYMGENYPIYEKVGIYNYQRANMTPEKVVSDYLTAWVSSEFTLNKAETTLLDEIVYRGKIMYVLSVLLPDSKKDVLMGYTPEQWAWSMDHEAQMWGSMLADKAIFSQDMIKNGGYLNDGPFTIHFSQESPARGGIFIGWRIVETYMKNNPEVSPLELMIEKNPNHILQNSGYNPKA